MATTTKAPNNTANVSQIKATMAVLNKLGAARPVSATAQPIYCMLVAHSIAPGTKAQVLPVALQVAKHIQVTLGKQVANLHFGHSGVGAYWLKKPGNWHTRFGQQVRPQCTKHNNHYTQCKPNCQYGIWVIKQQAFVHTMLVQGQGANKPTTKPQNQPTQAANSTPPASTPQAGTTTPNTSQYPNKPN